MKKKKKENRNPFHAKCGERVPVPISTPPAAGVHSGGGGGISPIPLSRRRRLPFSPAFRFPSTPRAVVLGRTHRPGLPGLHRRRPLVTIVVVPWSPSSTSAPSSSVLVSSCGFVGMAPLPQQLATVGCWWPLSLSLPRRPFLSLPVGPCHRPSLSRSIIHPASRCSQRWRVVHRFVVNNIDRT